MINLTCSIRFIQVIKIKKTIKNMYDVMRNQFFQNN